MRKNAVVFGVSFDTPEENRAFAEKFSFNFPLLSDTDRRMGVAYGAADSPAATKARRVGVVIGPEGKVKEWLPAVDPRKYPTEVVGRL